MCWRDLTIANVSIDTDVNTILWLVLMIAQKREFECRREEVSSDLLAMVSSIMFEPGPHFVFITPSLHLR